MCAMECYKCFRHTNSLSFTITLEGCYVYCFYLMDAQTIKGRVAVCPSWEVAELRSNTGDVSPKP